MTRFGTCGGLSQGTIARVLWAYDLDVDGVAVGGRGSGSMWPIFIRASRQYATRRYARKHRCIY